MNRISDGVPIKGEQVVAADIIAALGGVSFGHVVKVMAAIKVIHESLGVPYDELLKFENIPTALAEANSDRYEDTETTLMRLLDKIDNPDIKHIIRFDNRFSAHN